MTLNQFSEITPENTVWALVAFEGPDRYSLAGGLGVRVSELSDALAEQGYESHLIFVGSPDEPHKSTLNSHRTLWRVAQEVSARYPRGVYDGEEEKLIAFEQETITLLLALAREAREQEKLLIVMGEDWQTAQTMISAQERFYWQGLIPNVLMLWNANSTFGFDRVDWSRLSERVSVTVVSRYMKQKLLSRGVESLVIPNGIPPRHLAAIPMDDVRALEASVEGRMLLTKIARFDPDKNWLPAVQAVARLIDMGERPLFIARGGIESYGITVLHEMNSLGLRHVDLDIQKPTLEQFLEAIDELKEEADVILLRRFVPESIMRLLYRTSAAVLANSVHEPFGLVGLEVMGARGVAFVGSTGEDYAQHLLNCVTLDTTDPNEIVANLRYLSHQPSLVHNLRRMGHITARLYVWPRIIKDILNKLSYLLIATNRHGPPA